MRAMVRADAATLPNIKQAAPVQQPEREPPTRDPDQFAYRLLLRADETQRRDRHRIIKALIRKRERLGPTRNVAFSVGRTRLGIVQPLHIGIETNYRSVDVTSEPPREMTRATADIQQRTSALEPKQRPEQSVLNGPNPLPPW